MPQRAMKRQSRSQSFNNRGRVILQSTDFLAACPTTIQLLVLDMEATYTYSLNNENRQSKMKSFLPQHIAHLKCIKQLQHLMQ